jgi:hypothetical protein
MLCLERSIICYIRKHWYLLWAIWITNSILAKCRFSLKPSSAHHLSSKDYWIALHYVTNSAGVIYIFYDICSNINVFFQYETQDNDNLLLALCCWNSSCLLTTVSKTIGYIISCFICVSRMYKRVRMNAISLLLSTKLFTVYQHTLQYCCTFCVLHKITPIMKSHCQFLNTYSTTVFLVWFLCFYIFCPVYK